MRERGLREKSRRPKGRKGENEEVEDKRRRKEESGVNMRGQRPEARTDSPVGAWEALYDTFHEHRLGTCWLNMSMLSAVP